MTIAVHAFRDEAAEAQRLANALQMPLAFVDVHTFPDGEIAPRVPAPAPTTIVYRSLHRPNTRLVELLLAADAWRRNGAEHLVLVAPYLPYMRQDMAFKPGEPVSQRVISGLLDTAFDQIVTVDPHLHRITSLAELFPKAASTHLFAADALVPYLRARGLPATTLVIGPDIESATWTKRVAEPLGLDHATLRKTRRGDADVEIQPPTSLHLAGRPILLVDDICSTGGTLRQAVSLLHGSAAGSIMIFVAHMLGDDSVRQSLLRAGATSVLSTDSCPGPTSDVHLAPLLAQSLEALK